MIQVHDTNGTLVAEISEELLEDFYDEVFIEDKELLTVLVDYTPEARKQVSNYIIHRLAMVDPGHQPKVDYDG